ncbi:hypothetical protein IJD34_02750 [bacterium]|nr:hypothetical protein [bacterium]
MVKGVFNQNNQQHFTVEMKREDVKSFSDIMVFNSIDKNYDGVLQEAEVREYDAQQAKLNKGFEIAPEKQKTLSQIIKADKEAKKAFLDQLEDDGWAADVADGISILWNSKNRASKVREDFDESKSVINKLVEAAKVSDAEFLKAFKNAYGVDYNQELIDEYFKNPTKETFEKAFGTVQKDMTTRVKKYNQSQETGEKVVKTGAKMAAGAAVAVVTGGASLAATAATTAVASGASLAATAAAAVAAGGTSLAATAVGTAAASIVIDETDRLKVTELLTEGDVEFREGTNHKQILTEGAVTGISVYAAGKLAQGVKMIVPANVSINSVGEVIEVALTKGQKVARTALTMVGNVVIGAGEEYITTGDVTLSGTVQNAALSGLGSAVEYGFFKDGVKLIKGKLGFAAKNADEVLENLSSSNVVKNDVGIEINTKKKRYTIGDETPTTQAPKANDAGIEVVNVKKKRYTIGDETPTTQAPKANDAGIEVVNVKKKRYTIGDETPTTQAPKANDAGIEINTKKKPVFGLVDENPVAKSQVKPQAEVAPDVHTSSASFDARVRGNAETPVKPAKKQILIESPRSKMSKEKPVSARKPVEPVSAELPKSNPQPVPVEKMNIKEVYGEMDKLYAQMSSMRSGVEVDLDNQIHAAQSQLEGLEASKPSSLESSIEYQNSRNDFNRFHNEAINIRKNLTLLETQQGQVENALSRYSSLLSDLEESLDQCKAIHGVPDNTIGELYNHTPKPRKRVVTSKPKDDVMEIVMPDNLSASYIRDDIADLYNRFQVPSLKGKENVLIEIRAKLGMLEEELNNVNRQISNQEQNLSLANAQSDIAIGKASSLEDEYNSLLKDFNAKKQSIEQSIKDLKRAKTQAVNNVLDTPAYRGLKNFWKQLQGRARELS